MSEPQKTPHNILKTQSIRVPSRPSIGSTIPENEEEIDNVTSKSALLPPAYSPDDPQVESKPSSQLLTASVRRPSFLSRPWLGDRKRSSTSNGFISGFTSETTSTHPHKRSSSAVVTLDSFSRKQSGNSGQITFTTHVIQNTSIFKPDPTKELPSLLTVVTENFRNDREVDRDVVLYSPSEDLVRAHKEGYSCSSSPRTATPMTSLPTSKRPSDDVSASAAQADFQHISINMQDPLKRQKSHRRMSTAHHRARKMAVSTDGHHPSHTRCSSLATFITSPANNTLTLEKKPTLSLDAFTIPRRWISLRNVISFFNIIILIMAITVVALVSYFAGISSTRTAIMAMSNITINDLTLKLDDMLGHAEDLNVFSQDIFTTPEYPVTQTIKAMRHLYFFMSQFDQQVDQIYVASTDSTFSAVSVDRLQDGSVSEDSFLIKYLNRTTRPYRLTYRVSRGCVLNDTACIMDAFDGSQMPIQNISYNIRKRPFFQQALQLQRKGWTQVYQYPNDSALTLTAIQPVWLKGIFQYVCAVDITLTSLSAYLSAISQLIGVDQKSLPILFIMEASTELLVATSISSQMPLTDSHGNRLSVQGSNLPVVQNTIRLLRGMYPDIGAIPWPEDGSPLVLEDGSAHILIGPYQRAGPDINWIIVAYIPFSTYNDRLNSAHYVEVPLAAACVLLIAMICSVYVTRSIGRPLKHIAQEMLRVADLNFADLNEEEPVIEQQETVQQSRASLESLMTSAHCLPYWLHRWFPFMFREPLTVVSSPTAPTLKKRKEYQLKELKYLESAMHAMKSGLKSFSKYVPIDVVTLLMKLQREAVLGVDEVELTIFFSDIVNFTTVAESIPPSQLVALMSEYLSEMSDIILGSQGIVDKYIGDAIMAFWNAPLTLPHHATTACLVALQVQKRLGELRKEWRKKGWPEIQQRIGLNTGYALVGNIGSTTRLNYTCLGDAVNLASRLEGLNKRYQTGIIISEFTLQQVPPQMFATRPLEIVAVKGKSKAVRVYELLDLRKSQSAEEAQAYAIYQEAFDALERGEIDVALRGFQVTAEQLEAYWSADDLAQPEYRPRTKRLDHVSRLHIDRCQQLVKEGKPENWSCVVYLDDK